jgi:hypothetical protein
VLVPTQYLAGPGGVFGIKQTPEARTGRIYIKGIYIRSYPISKKSAKKSAKRIFLSFFGAGYFGDIL